MVHAGSADDLNPALFPRWPDGLFRVRDWTRYNASVPAAYSVSTVPLEEVTRPHTAFLDRTEEDLPRVWYLPTGSDDHQAPVLLALNVFLDLVERQDRESGIAGLGETPAPQLPGDAAGDIDPVDREYLFRMDGSPEPHGVIGLGESNTLFGPPGSGKSTLAQLLAFAAVTEQTVPGLVQQRSAAGMLIVTSEEDRARDVRPRLESFGFESKRDGERVRIHDAEDLGSIEALKALLAMLPESWIAIVDSLESVANRLGLKPENANDANGLLDVLIGTARDRLVTLLCIEHEKDGEQRQRQSAAFRQRPRFVYRLIESPAEGAGAERVLFGWKCNPPTAWEGGALVTLAGDPLAATVRHQHPRARQYLRAMERPDTGAMRADRQSAMDRLYDVLQRSPGTWHLAADLADQIGVTDRTAAKYGPDLARLRSDVESETIPRADAVARGVAVSTRGRAVTIVRALPPDPASCRIDCPNVAEASAPHSEDCPRNPAEQVISRRRDAWAGNGDHP